MMTLRSLNSRRSAHFCRVSTSIAIFTCFARCSKVSWTLFFSWTNRFIYLRQSETLPIWKPRGMISRSSQLLVTVLKPYNFCMFPAIWRHPRSRIHAIVWNGWRLLGVVRLLVIGLPTLAISRLNIGVILAALSLIDWICFENVTSLSWRRPRYIGLIESTNVKKLFEQLFGLFR